MSYKVLVSIDVTPEQLELISSSGDIEITVKNQKNLQLKMFMIKRSL